jgi:hypothetical protein
MVATLTAIYAGIYVGLTLFAIGACAALGAVSLAWAAGRITRALLRRV